MDRIAKSAMHCPLPLSITEPISWAIIALCSLSVHVQAASHAAFGAQSYYGSLLCCCWTHDGRYVAAGGEDDLVSVYGMAERALVSWGSGHLSWVSRVSFDPW